MNNIKIFIRKYAYFIIVLFLILITFRNWFFKNTILTNGDWWYYTKNSLEAFRLQYFHLWLGDQDFGRTIVDVAQAPSYAMYGVLAKLGLSYSVGERLIHFCPAVLLAPFSSYIFLSYLSKNKYAIAVGSAVFCCNTYYLQLLTGDVTLAAAFSIAPLVLFCFINNFQKPSYKNAIYAAIASLIMDSYEPRVFYVEMIGVFIYSFGFLITHPLKYYLRDRNRTLKLILPFILVLLLNFFWLIGLYKIGGDSSNSILSRNLFGSFFFRLQNSITISQPFWTGYAPVSFVYHKISFSQWIIPTLGVFGVTVRRKSKIAIYLIIIVFVGIFLGKQTSQPVTRIYPWLYSVFPGFNAFREGSKFYLLSALGYSGLATLGISWIMKQHVARYLKVFAVIVPLSLLIFNLKPFITNDIGTTVVARHTPSAYIKWNKFISSQHSFSRTLWIPDYSRWIDNTDEHPIVSAVRLSQSSWQELNLINNNYSGSPNSPLEDQIANLYKQDIINELLNTSAIKYVAVPIRDTANNDDFFQNYGNERDFYINLLKSIPDLRKVNTDSDGLVVYQNLNYKSYFSVGNKINKIPSIADAGVYYSFEKAALHQNQSIFYSGDDTNILPGNDLSDIFENIKPSDINNNGITENIKLNRSEINELYYESNQPSYGFKVYDHQISFNRYYQEPVSVDGKTVNSSTGGLVSTTNITPNRNYYFDTKGSLYPINLNTIRSQNIGATNSTISLYSVPNKENIVSNPSFENGLWHRAANDCNPHGEDGNVSILLSSQVHYSGRYSLQLASRSYTSCTSSPPFNVIAGQTYRLGYEFKLIHGQKAGYDLIFNNSKHTVVSSDQVGSDNTWHELDTTFTVPKGSTSVKLRLKGYPDDTGQYEALTYYDDLNAQPLKLEAQPAADFNPIYLKDNLLNSSSLKLEVNSKNNSQNLIHDPSLEQGLWQKTVNDCDNYDNNPILAMSLNKSSKTNGRQSLELDTTRHVACTSPRPANVAEGNDYQFSFDYRSPNSNLAGFAIAYNDQGKTVINKQLTISNTDWQHFSEIFRIPFGATNATISVYGYPNEYGTEKEINLYDNFSFRKVPSLLSSYFLVSNNRSVLSSPTIKSVSINNPIKKYLSVKNAKSPFVLNMSETYSMGWRLELNDSKSQGLDSWLPTADPKSIANKDHLNQDGFLNSWYVDPAVICQYKSSACTENKNGSYNIKLVAEFVPERYFDVGLIVSCTTASICLSYLIMLIINKRKSNQLNHIKNKYFFNKRR